MGKITDEMLEHYVKWEIKRSKMGLVATGLSTMAKRNELIAFCKENNISSSDMILSVLNKMRLVVVLSRIMIALSCIAIVEVLAQIYDRSLANLVAQKLLNTNAEMLKGVFNLVVFIALVIHTDNAIFCGRLNKVRDKFGA